MGLVAGEGDTDGVVARGRLLLGLVAGMAVIYAGGLSQLWILTGQELPALVAVGVAPILLGDATKVRIAFVVTVAARRARPDRSPGRP